MGQKTLWMTKVAEHANHLHQCLGIVHHEGYDAEATEEFKEVHDALVLLEKLSPKLKEIAEKYPGYLRVN